MVIFEITRKYRAKYSENKQKSEKNEFFYEKKRLQALFLLETRYFS